MTYYSKENPCVIVFKIENFSSLGYCKTDDYLYACFNVLDQQIYIYFYPRKEGQCCCFLVIPNNEYLFVSYSFELISNGNKICSNEFKHDLTSGCKTSEWKNFVNYEDVLKDKDKYLINDCLTLHIFLWGITLKLPNLKRILCYSTLFEKEKCSLNWKIQDIKLNQIHLNNFCFSNGYAFVLKLSCFEENDINITIETQEFKKSFYLKIGMCLTILSGFTGIEIQHCYKVTEEHLVLPSFNIDNINGQEMCFKFKFSMFTREAVNEYEIDNDFPDSSSYTPNSVEDFVFMFKNKIMTDVCFQVEERKLLAHKFVLISRSPVFREMFEHDTLEKQSDVIDTEGISFDILKEFIYSLYGAPLQNVTFEKSKELIQLAEKYQVLKFKKECAKHLECFLCEKYFCEILTISDVVKDEILKRACMEFFKSNRKRILNSNEWKEFSENCKELTLEVLTIYARDM